MVFGVDIRFQFSEIMLRSATAGLYGNCKYSFIRNSQSVFQSGCTVLCSSFSASLPAFDIAAVFNLNCLVGVC